jgi:hypothetical protein
MPAAGAAPRWMRVHHSAGAIAVVVTLPIRLGEQSPIKRSTKIGSPRQGLDGRHLPPASAGRRAGVDVSVDAAELLVGFDHAGDAQRKAVSGTASSSRCGGGWRAMEIIWWAAVPSVSRRARQGAAQPAPR